MSSDRGEAERLLSGIDVSRETWAALECIVAELVRWDRAQNLVGPGTLDEIWSRHVADSIQIAPLLTGEGAIVDIGSGAGFPGLAVAAWLRNQGAVPDRRIHLVESNKRKAAFLRSAARAAGLTVQVHAARAEVVIPAIVREPGGVSWVTARALAPLAMLFELGEAAFRAGAGGLFHKGRRFEMELSAARRYWTFQVDTIPSRVSQDSVILRFSDIERLQH